MLRQLSCSLYALLWFCALPASALEWRAEVIAEGRYFTQSSGAPGFRHNGSLALRGELFHQWNDRRDQVIFSPFFRVDENDPERTHGDLRELVWMHVADGFESRIGIGKVFWGVAEGRHLVDIINQTDAVEQQDLEDKLGQPMINISMVRDWGTLDLFVLPGFRERTFAGRDGRPGLPVPVNDDAARYASAAGRTRIDGAIRWRHRLAGAQFALSHFSGNGREPLLLPNINDALSAGWMGPGTPLPAGFRAELQPFYPVIEQSGLEIDYVAGGWLLKLEAIRRSGNRFERRMHALVTGVEYTQFSLLGSNLDLGWIVEYFREDRDPAFRSPFDDDWLLGNRLTFDDVAGSELLWGLVFDPDTGERFYSLESSRRFGNHWRATLEAQIISNAGAVPSASEVFSGMVGKPLSVLGGEDLIQLEVIRFF